MERPPRKPRPTSDAMSVKRTSVSVYFVLAIIIIYTLLHVFNMARSHMAATIPTEVIRLGTIDTPQTVSGIIIRDERVYLAPRDGQLVFAVSEFERVQPGTRIASIQDTAAVAGINRDMLALDQRALLVGHMRQDQEDPNVARMNNHIRGQVNNRAHLFTSMHLNDLYLLRDNLNQSITGRNQLIISGGIHAGGEYARQYAELLAQLGIHSTDMYARSGGIMTPILDNFENKFTVSGMYELTREQLNFTPDPIPLFPAQELYAQQPAFKIVGNTWFIAAYIPNEMIQGFARDQHRTIYVESPTTGDFMPLPVRIERVLDGGMRDSRVVFRVTRYVIDFMHIRNVNIRTTQTVETGLKIPNTAVTNRDYYIIPLPFLHGLVEHTVLRRAGEGNESIPVTVALWDGAYVHIRSEGSGLQRGDVLLDGIGGLYTVENTKTIQGIFNVNHGFADFRPIFTDSPITERGGTTLLCPTRNRGSLREFDSIVVDANMVSDGDLIR